MTAENYIRATKNYFWKWEEEGEILSMTNGQTIAYKNYVSDIIKQFHPQPVPSFGALLLAIIATNLDGEKNLQKVFQQIEKNTTDLYLIESLSFLLNLSKIPDEYKKGYKRIQVFQTIFENYHNGISLLKIKDELIKLLENNQIDTPLVATTKYKLKDFKGLSLLHKKYPTPQKIIAALTNLPDLQGAVIPPNISSKEGEEFINKNLIEELINHHEAFLVGNLVKNIWSGLHLPSNVGSPSDQPLGGVTDISNKGNFDRLLLSEYANEEILFLSRLANNEALYYHKETPPRHNNHERILLIDITLKNWGNIKTIAYAIMVAITHQPKHHVPCIVFAIGEKVYPIKFNSLNDILEGMQHLDSNINPFKGLEYFLKEYDLKNKEIIIISSKESLEHPDLLPLFVRNNPIDYWIEVSVKGKIDIYKKHHKTKKHLKNFQLDLDLLWNQDHNSPYQQVDDITTIPLLFPFPDGHKEILTLSHDNFFVLTRRGSLLKIYDTHLLPSEKGMELVYEDIPLHMSLFAIGQHHDETYVLFTFNTQTKEGLLTNLNTKEKKTFNLETWIPNNDKKFIFYIDHFYFQNFNSYWKINLDGKVHLTPLSPPDDLTKRYFQISKEKIIIKKKTQIVSQQTLNNIKHVSINNDGDLVINKHRLNIDNNGYIKLIINNQYENIHVANKTSEHEFIFPDGSSLFMYKEGVCKLKSSNLNLPIVYVPLVLDKSLGLSTKREFTGNHYFIKSGTYKIELTDRGPNPAKTTKYLKSLNSTLPSKIHETEVKLPYIITEEIGQRKMESIKSHLETIGATITTTPVLPALKKTWSKYFFTDYINTFIKQITNNGA